MARARFGTPEAAVARAEWLSDVLDGAFRVPGTDFRVGLDPILGALPVAGDLVTGALSLYVVAEAVNVGVPRHVVARMLAVIAIDIAVGAVPILGDLFDAVWRANQWNARWLAEHVEQTSVDADVDPAAVADPTRDGA